ncbi:1-acyl-sn-glycerol-3-phosphate acyltransferase [Nocardioides sp. CER19]|uniref:1-acyl-sn-glycerol-3-phosphate acyltransferase n=1 Tax=Nocardioides sp. CER19 TaxID=3038538 RepID=UPI002446B20D|nr:1-acyl-sn-glycerol-3-phosphate acyltransferase [Nocardioides sp. CER19]MDH2414249.1 1-acyl-sn-glycerol-3-phosphate acyltransferase [Nocardioides sp. CER19]
MEGAEVIPIGTRGRPGRGTGQRPSAAARGLAGKAAKGPAQRPPRPKKAAEPPVVQAVPEEAAEAPVSAAVVRERSPMAGIPVSDWQAALEGAAREVLGTDWEQQLARLLAFLRRRVTGDYVVDDYGFDAELTQRFLLATLRPIAEKWFRIEVRGTENIPADGGALVVSNHSGTIPVDGLMTMVSIHDHTGRFLRPLGADLVFRMPFVSSLARKAGATLACSEDAERMLRGGELVGVWPEGFKGIGKPYSERYKLQRFGRGGFVSAALRTGVPIIPLSVVGAEEIYPLVGNVPSLARILGVPYLPITPFFPLLGPLGLVPLPSKWIIEFGEPIRTDDYDAGAADDPMLVFNVTDQVRETIQQTLYSLLMQRPSVFR